MEVDQSAKARKTTPLGASSREKSAPPRRNQPKSTLKPTTQALATSSLLTNVLETPSIPQKELVEFLEDLEAEIDNDNGVIIIENEDETSLDVSKS